MHASTTSLTVPPRAVLTTLTSDNRARAQSQRRLGPIGPLSDDAGVGLITSRIRHRPRAASCPTLTISPGSVSARVAASGTSTFRAIALVNSSTPSGACSGVQVSCAAGSGSRWRSSSSASRSVPATPSTMQWWNFEISAQRPSSKPSTIHISHSGLARSSCCDITRPTSRRSS